MQKKRTNGMGHSTRRFHQELGRDFKSCLLNAIISDRRFRISPPEVDEFLARGITDLRPGTGRVSLGLRKFALQSPNAALV